MPARCLQTRTRFQHTYEVDVALAIRPGKLVEEKGRKGGEGTLDGHGYEGYDEDVANGPVHQLVSHHLQQHTTHQRLMLTNPILPLWAQAPINP